MNRADRYRATHLPDKESLLLPFSFGNTLRAFEIYPRAMYGIDAIPAWCRLLGVIPTEFREQLDGAKSQMDFLLNVWALSHLLLLEYLIVAWMAGFWQQWQHWLFWWFPALSVGVALFASYWARRAAVDWGELVKSAFDLFLPELRAKLELPRPASPEEEREMWGLFNQALVFRDPEFFDKLRRFAHERQESSSKRGQEEPESEEQEASAGEEEPRPREAPPPEPPDQEPEAAGAGGPT